MGNFSFLNDIDEYSDFAELCNGAENAFKKSPISCVSQSRTALENVVKWLCNKENFLLHNESEGKDVSLSDLMISPSFKDLVPQEIQNNIHKIRMLANRVLHEGYQPSKDQALMCLKSLFEFVQWIDERYNRNSKPRTFNPGDVPNGSSWLKEIGKALLFTFVGFVIGHKLGEK